MTGRFDDGKDQGALRTIGEVARAFGLRQHVLRYWEQHFPALRPLKRGGQRRYYRPEDVALVEAIDRLVNRDGYTLKGAQKALEQNGKMDSVQQQDVSPEPYRTSSDAPQEPAAAPEPILPLGSDLPSDGGLEAFFGAPSAAPQQDGAAHDQPPAGPDGDPGLVSAPDHREDEPGAVPAEVIAGLKAVRARLAAALEQ